MGRPFESMDDLKGKKILILKLRYIGDTLSLIPVLENLKEKVADISIDVMVNKGTEEVLAHHPGIRKLWVYERSRAKKKSISSLDYHWGLIKKLRSRSYDVVIDFTHGDRAAFISFLTGASKRISYQNASTFSHLLMNQIIQADPRKYHIVDYQLLSLRLFGLDHFSRFSNLPVTQAIQEKVDALLVDLKIKPGPLKVVIHPGARGRLRQWAPERFAEIARRLSEALKADIILVGGPREGNLVDDVERHMGFHPSLKSTGLSLLEMGALLRRCHLFLGNDSAPGHLAAAVECPTLSLFGPTFPNMWRPLTTKGKVIFKNVPCRGCRQETCVRPENNCMDLIGVDEVWEETEALLKSL